jgi:putative ABC transport system ATP-binding protein/lipoprotein-releasing system ATP-binding protein
MKILEAFNVERSFGDPPPRILKNISFDVEPGEFVAITGRSGSGKSTLFYVISGLDDITSGHVLISGRDIHRMKRDDLHRFRNMQMGFVFQFHYLLPELTSIENILMPARKSGFEKQKRSYALELMSRFEIEHCAGKVPGKMSGGEQQRVSVARSLIMNPEIIFADEPTGNLDSVNGEKVMDIFEEINRENGTTVMLITHEEDYAKRASRIIHLVDGEIAS